jgi:serine/threonine-protein kinase
MIGTRLAHYEITAHLGTGGMGEVYQATDGKLGRSVAIKLLPRAFANDEERVARFEREARVLASLNHPNIATIHGLEESGAQKFLVMELVPGETLAERIVQGALPVDEALGIAKAIAEGLEAAHEHGVIHRDLKPANVKITPDGRVKILDFGLAKAFAGSDQTEAGVSESPTITAAATERGVILGTAAYMSPEQARGRSVDRRTDIWALGCVLYEALAARQAFPGDTVTDILANVVKSEPDWSALPAGTPAAARALLRSCLQKDPRRRCQHVGDARIAIEDAIAQPVTSVDASRATTVAAVARPLWRRAIPILVTAIVAGALASAVTWYLGRPGPRAVVRFPIAIPEERQLRRSPVLDVSPDGTRLAYTAGGQLFVHDLAETEARAITGKDVEAQYPLFSPDGSWIVFWSRNDLTLRKVAVEGGMPLLLCKTNDPYGMSWHGESIVFTTAGGGSIQRVSENGGEPETLIASKPGELWDGPQLLNGGNAVLYTIAEGQGADRWDKARVVVQSLASGERKVVVEGGSAARYLPTGHLMYAVGGTLMAVAFDPVSLEVRGRAVPVVDGIVRSANPASTGASAQFAWSNAGTLAYVKALGSATQLRLALLDRNGTTQPLPLPAREWIHPRVSPDGSQLAVGTDDGREAAVWIYALKGGGEPRRLTFEGRNTSPIWMPDGKHVTFQSDREGDLALFTQQADGLKPAERVAKPEAGLSLRPEAWTKGGILAFLKFPPPGSGDVWTLSQGGGPPKPLVALPDSNQRFTAFHPSGQWFAYASSELGRGTTNFHIFVQPFPATGAKFQASTSSPNGSDPLWSPDGKRLFYVVRPANEVVAVDIDPKSGFVGTPSPVRGLRVQSGGPGRGYDIMPDGTFVTVLPPDSARRPAEQINIVLNWFEELKRLVPTR